MQVGEGLPAEDCSMDVVVGTLVLCSVKDVHGTLQGTNHPISFYLFMTMHINVNIYFILLVWVALNSRGNSFVYLGALFFLFTWFRSLVF